MSHTDPIADMISRINNAAQRRKSTVAFPASKLKMEVAKILKDNGFIDSFEFSEQDNKTSITVILKYHDKLPGICHIERLSSPGQRLYSSYKDYKTRGRSNRLTVVSTSRGVMTSREARERKLGGELICTIW